MFSFKGKGALVIGAGQNIGREIVLEFARRGARVAVADINAEGAVETAAMIREQGGEAVGLAVDVTSEESLRDVVDEAERFLGAIDVHVNNAGLLHVGHIEDFPVAEWQRMFDVNLFGAVRANALVLPKMIAAGQGYIVNTASFAGLYPYASNRIPYAASKAALVSMSENMAIYLEPLGIRVSCLCPGPTYTTSNLTMRKFTQDAPMRGPGGDLMVKSQPEVAAILADAMEAGRILVLTHDGGWDHMRDHVSDPDGFLRAKIDAYGRGESGLPPRPAATA